MYISTVEVLKVSEFYLRKSVRNSFFVAISLVGKEINFTKSATNGNFEYISSVGRSSSLKVLIELNFTDQYIVGKVFHAYCCKMTYSSPLKY